MNDITLLVLALITPFCACGGALLEGWVRQYRENKADDKYLKERYG